MEDTQKPGNTTVPLDSEAIKMVRDLQSEFKTRTNGGKISQTRVASLAMKKLTIEDLLNPRAAKAEAAIA
jgi:hypothetical protein